MTPNAQPICQSCGMPMTPDQYGKNKDGSPNAEYCIYCYPSGAFNVEGETMEEMIESCIPHMVGGEFTEEAARKLMQETLPQLKRWKKA
jgi:multimeric flavodoxin WrbA